MITIRDPAYHVRIAVLAVSLTLFCTTSSAQILETNRLALEALYHATDGDNWINNTGWLTSDIRTWHGVVYDILSRIVVAIDLSGNNLTGKIPLELGQIFNLKTLDLSNNKLTGEIPFTLGNLQWLEKLNLQNNLDLTGTLPISLTNLRRLENFWFDGTNLCESKYGPFQSWISSVVDVRRTGCTALFDESLVGTCDRPLGEQFLDVNNVRARIVNTGGLFYRGNPHVYEVPIHSGSNAIFAGALWIAGIIDGDLRASAARYGNNELWAGPLDELGHPPEDCKVYDRIYKVSSSDIHTYEATGIASDDLREWPTGLGAPTVDADGNEIDLMDLPLSARRDRVINLAAGERPRVLGNQSLWWVMNDRGNEHKSTDTLPMGIEVHGHAFAAAGGEIANNTTLYNFRIFNRNVLPLTEAYVGVFLDTDLGDFDDDYVGSDSTLGMGLTYNADDFDGGGEGYGSPPPALGMLFIEGPVADDDLVDNDRDGVVDEPGERLRTTAVGTYYGGGGVSGDPTTGTHYYTYMQGQWKDGKPYTYGGNGRDFSNIPTHWFYSGDPVTSEFWSEMNADGLGTRIEPGDRRWFISSGPFSLGAGEDTDFTFAIVWALGKDRLDSVSRLRKVADRVRKAFEIGAWNEPILISEDPVPAEPNPSAALADNFPEPFFESTTIRYRVPHFANVQLVVLDMLGREVSVLVREPQSAGEYSVTFVGTDLPSGVYFYRIEMDHASATRSMMLVK
ncbi:MAG: T9SS type A sorting domain-containing protein [Bacteroidetes bacterium]|nr:T9SS type A sorting domain-containing protein [Bacteroidota bacterium]